MDLMGIFALLAGLFLVVFGICFNDVSFSLSTLINFYSISSIAITFGGTIAATLLSYPASYFKNIPKHLKILLKKSPYDPQKYISTIVEFAEAARRKGLLSLEDMANNEKDPFLKNSVMLIVDAVSPDKVKDLLDMELDNLEDRHAHGWQFYEKSATYAPAFGMIGTLIGLINMLKNMDMSATDGATKMAQGMSVALITTFYGSMIANLFLVPIAQRLHMRHDEEMICKEIVVQGVIAIQSGDNPRFIEERLNSFLCQKVKEKMNARKKT